MELKGLRLKESLTIHKLFSFLYLELVREYVHEGEEHDFWEFLYVDKGEVEITAYNRVHHLKQGDIIFYKPNIFHSLKTNERAAPNLIIISFDCHSPSMSFFENKLFRLSEHERFLLSILVKEAFLAFDPSIDTPPSNRDYVLQRKQQSSFGCEQFIKIYLEALLLHIIRRGVHPHETQGKIAHASKEAMHQDLVSSIVQYLENHISTSMSLDQLSEAFSIGKTQLKMIFKENIGQTVKEYFNKLKIDRAKIMIREERYNFSQISDLLGYSSVHYFSKHFKKSTDMTPSEYAKTVNARAWSTNKFFLNKA